MIRIYPLVFFILCCWGDFFFLPSDAGAQDDALVEPVPLSSMRDLGAEEVLQHLGPPDRKQAVDEDRESWWYGKSIVFFNQGKVTAWSDSGDFTQRKNLSRIKAEQPQQNQEAFRQWPNDWTPPRADQLEDEVLRRILAK